jgi:hypothetical protein
LQPVAGVWFGTNRLIFPVTTVCDRLPVSTTTTTTTLRSRRSRAAKKKYKKLARRRKIAIVLGLYTHPYLLKTPVRTSIRTGEIFTNEILNVHPRPSAEFTVPLVTNRLGGSGGSSFLGGFLGGFGGHCFR